MGKEDTMGLNAEQETEAIETTLRWLRAEVDRPRSHRVAKLLQARKLVGIKLRLARLRLWEEREAAK